MYKYVQPLVACIAADALGMDSFDLIKAMAVAPIFPGVYPGIVSRSRTDTETHACVHKDRK